MTKITLTDLSNLENQTSAVSAINTNNTVLEAAIDNTISRDGTSPNQMNASLDMNSNHILNLPAPISADEPVRYTDIQDLTAGGTIIFNSIPIGGTTGQTLTKNSSTNYDASWRGPVTITPEMFGVTASPANTSPASVPDSTIGLQNALDYIASIGGGTLFLGPGVYGTRQLNISANYTYIRGVGIGATTLMHICNTDSVCLNFSAGAGTLYTAGIFDLSIGSADIVFDKAAICLSDVSQAIIQNVMVAHYPVDGTMYRGAASAGKGFWIRGRDLGHVDNIVIYANNPIYLDNNPNTIIGLGGHDSWTYNDCTLVAPLVGMAGTSNSVITAADGLIFTNLKFTGHQNWIGGLNGFFWNDTLSIANSTGVYFEGIKSEQAGQSGGYAVYISVKNNLYSLSIKDAMMGDRNGIALNRAKTISLENVYYDASSNPTKIALSVSNALLLDITNCTWFPTSINSLGGLTPVSTVFPTGLSVDVPATAIYKV